MRWTSAQAFAFAAASAAATCVVAFMPIAAGSADDEQFSDIRRQNFLSDIAIGS